MTLRWQRRIGDASSKGMTGQCIATPLFNGKLQYLGGNQSTVKGIVYLGSVQARRPGSGALAWETPLADGVTGSPSIDAGGVLAVPAYYPPAGSAPDAVYLIDPASGRILRVLDHGREFAQAVFARRPDVLRRQRRRGRMEGEALAVTTGLPAGYRPRLATST
jgi:hypothetical protein